MTNFLDDQNASYDKLAKHFLSRKSILAQILKYIVEKFADFSLSYINTIPFGGTINIKGFEYIFN